MPSESVSDGPGLKIFLLDCDRETLAVSVGKLARAGIKVHGQDCDVTSGTGCRGAVNMALDALGGIDILVLNAGITQRGLFEQTSLEALRRVMEVNFFGALNPKRRMIPGKEDRPERVAQAVYEAVAKRKKMVILTAAGKAAYLLTRTFPALYDRLMTGRVRAEFDPEEGES